MPECSQVVASVGHQGNGCAAVEIRPPSINVVEVRSPLEEQHAICRSPYCFVKHRRLGACRNQSYPVAVVTHSPQPLHSLAPKRRVTLNPASPGLAQAVIGYRVVRCRRLPRPDYWCARIKIERPEGAQDLGWRKPLIIFHRRALVSAQAHFVASVWSNNSLKRDWAKSRPAPLA